MAKKTQKSLVVPKKKMVAIPTADEQDRYCFFCARHLKPSSFYSNSDPRIHSHLSPMCRTCAKEMAERYEFGEPRGATKESIKTTLRFLNKPFVTKLYHKAVQRVKDEVNKNESLWTAYIGLIQRDAEYKDLPWEMSDELAIVVSDEKDEVQKELDKEILEDLRIARRDVVRLIGYDPFVDAPQEDQPLLYAKTISFLDGAPDVNEDAMKLSSIVEIVKLFNQAEKINDTITDLSKTKQMIADNIATINTLQKTKKDIMTTALNLAKDNGISVLHNTNKSKGSNTFVGMSKKLNELNLREHSVNSFDIDTADGMEQVANLSHRAILNQISLNENDFPEIIADQRQLIMRWKKIAADAAEQARILMQENIDLKKTLEIMNTDLLNENLEPFEIYEGVNSNEVLEDGFIEEMSNVSEDILTESVLDFEGGEDDE